VQGAVTWYGIFDFATMSETGSNHPMMDGNKRTAFVVLLLFVHWNGIALNASNEDKYVPGYRCHCIDISVQLSGHRIQMRPDCTRSALDELKRNHPSDIRSR